MSKLDEVISSLGNSVAKKVDFRDKGEHIKVSPSFSHVSVADKEYPLTDTGKLTLCKTLGIPKNYFKRYPVTTELSEHANTLLKAKAETEFLIRSNDNGVRAILPNKYAIFDNLDVLGVIKKTNQFDTSNVTSAIANDRMASYCVLFGEPADKKDEIFPMVRITNSEVNLANLTVEMGLFRLICTNGAVRKTADFGYFHWSHSLRTVNAIPGMIEHSINIGLSKCFDLQVSMEKSRDEKLKTSFSSVLSDLMERSYISSSFAKKLQTENEAIPATTKFDVVNLITRLAQNESSWSTRSRYENVATMLLDNKDI